MLQKKRNAGGGGLLTAADPSLDPMMISTKNDEAEFLSVQMVVNKQKNKDN